MNLNVIWHRSQSRKTHIFNQRQITDKLKPVYKNSNHLKIYQNVVKIIFTFILLLVIFLAGEVMDCEYKM